MWLCVFGPLETDCRAASAGRSCGESRQVYADKGYSLNTAPLTQISGKTDKDSDKHVINNCTDDLLVMCSFSIILKEMNTQLV